MKYLTIVLLIISPTLIILAGIHFGFIKVLFCLAMLGGSWLWVIGTNMRDDPEDKKDEPSVKPFKKISGHLLCLN